MITVLILAGTTLLTLSIVVAVALCMASARADRQAAEFYQGNERSDLR